MAVYVGPLQIRRRSMAARMIADTAEEMHRFAQEQLGLYRGRCYAANEPMHPHYLLTTELRDRAIAAGAVACDSHEYVRMHLGMAGKADGGAYLRGQHRA